jgi:hypothetical protein
VVAVFPQYTIEQLMNDVPETFLYQAENIFATRHGLICVKPGKRGVSDEFKARWEMTTGRKWNESQT